jgi:long-chain acyl-CoA synthetase
MRLKHTLITGGNGTLGREVIPRILQHDPDATVTLLLRAGRTAGVPHRLEELKRYVAHWWPGLDLTRVQAAQGDVTLRGLGLESRESEKLRSQVTTIIHAAASTRLIDTLERANRTNLSGTANALRFASLCPKFQRFAHISTAFVSGDRTGRICESELNCGQGFVNAYERSKFEAERLVRAHSRNLPISIFRPSIIVGDSWDGHIGSFTNIYLPLKRIARGDVRHISGPGTTRLDLVPVDFVAEALIRLVQSERSLGRTYHLAAGPSRATPVRQLVEQAVELAGAHPERPIHFVDGPTPERHLSCFFAYLAQQREFDDRNLWADLGVFAALRPSPQHLLPSVFDFCRSTHWGEKLPWEEKTCVAATV